VEVAVLASERGARKIAVAMVLAAAGCGAVSHAPRAPGSGIFHEVRRGENLYRISKAYGVSLHELARVNDIRNPDRVAVGQRIFVPGSKRSLPVNLITPEAAVSGAPEIPPSRRGEAVFIWPLARGTLTSSFGPRGQSFHDGIDIGAPAGTLVRATRDGAVIYSDTLRGYGNVVIIEHAGGYATVYAHNERNLVRAGDRVRQGDMVARVGGSGRTSGSNLHFEIRKDNVAHDPIYFLPTQTAQRARNGPT
jgi:LysM repeat protein